MCTFNIIHTSTIMPKKKSSQDLLENDANDDQKFTKSMKFAALLMFRALDSLAMNLIGKVNCSIM